MKLVLFHEEAEAELDAAVDYYEQIREGLGVDLQNQVEHAIGLIRQNPHLFPQHNPLGIQKCLLKRFPYTIFFLEFNQYIWVVAVTHQKRKPGYWKNRVV